MDLVPVDRDVGTTHVLHAQVQADILVGKPERIRKESAGDRKPEDEENGQRAERDPEGLPHAFPALAAVFFAGAFFAADVFAAADFAVGTPVFFSAGTNFARSSLALSTCALMSVP